LPPASSANSADRPDWAAIAHDYAESTLTVPELCALHSVSSSGLYHRANLDGWTKRSAARRAAAAHRPPPPRHPQGEADLARRLLTALDHKMRAFETRMTQAAAAPITAADSERDARTLNTLVRLFDKLKGFGAKAVAGAGAPAANRPAGKDIYDADSFRHDLARRLERLRDGIGG
jgi:hypothetical protein